jgi:hypothetical protein
MIFPGSNNTHFRFNSHFWPIYLLSLVLILTRVLVNQTLRKAKAKRKDTKKHIHMKWNDFFFSKGFILAFSVHQRDCSIYLNTRKQ